MRIPVLLTIHAVANGISNEEILKEYPDLEPDDMKESLRYAPWLAEEELPSGPLSNL